MGFYKLLNHFKRKYWESICNFKLSASKYRNQALKSQAVHARAPKYDVDDELKRERERERE